MKRIIIAFFAATISFGAAAQELTEAQKAAAEAAAKVPPAKPADIVLLEEIRDLLKK